MLHGQEEQGIVLNVPKFPGLREKTPNHGGL